jgi:hypothetical protein
MVDVGKVGVLTAIYRLGGISKSAFELAKICVSSLFLRGELSKTRVPTRLSDPVQRSEPVLPI